MRASLVADAAPGRRPQRAAALRTPAALLSAPAALAALVCASFLARLQAALAQSVPTYFPDEYIYASLARSLASGSLEIRGTPARFPALLEPLLAAPFWLPGDVELAYRLTQGLHALAVSLAAVPLYWLARRLGLPAWQALLAGACAVAAPGLLYASFLTADAVAYPLVAGAVAAGVAALDRPSPRSQALFLALAALVALARVPYLILLLAFALAALAVERGRPLGAGRRFPLVAAALALPAPAALALGPGRLLGYYKGLLELELDPAAIGHWLAVDALLLAYASGLVLVPAALAGLALGVARPRSRAERAFAALAAALCAGLLLEAAVYAASGSERFQERYLLAVPALAPLAFCLGAARLPRGRLASLLVAGGLLVLVVRVPLSGYTVLTGKQDSPFLAGVHAVERWLGYGSGSLLVALVAGALLGVAAAACARPRAAAAAGLAAALTASLLAATAATAEQLHVSRVTRAAFLPADKRWVDRARLGPTAVLVLPGAERPLVSSHLFWNTSLTEVLRLPGGPPIDAFGHREVEIAADGRLVDGRGRAIRKPLLVEEYAASAVLEGAALLQRAAGTSLWRPAGRPRVALLVVGRYLDGWLAPRSRITVWPARGGQSVRLTVSLPDGYEPQRLELSWPGGRRTVRVEPGQPRLLELPAGTGKRTFEVTGRRAFALSYGRTAAVQATVPELVATGSRPGRRLPITSA
jgi:hypothetical protein